MTIATGDAALAADVAAINTLATSASITASTALANAATALSNSVAAQATAAAAEAAASVALSVPALPVVPSVQWSDTVPIGQDGTTVAATLATLNAGVNAAITSVGSVAASAMALASSAAAMAASGLNIAALPVVTSVNWSNTVPIGQGSTTVAATLSTLLNAETIDLLGAATAAADTDTFMVGQASNILMRQTMAAVWTYLQGKIPGYKIPVQEITASKTLDATYCGQILVVTGAGITLTPNYLLMGPGFECEIVTSGSGTVIWGAGITATNGGAGLSSANAYAKLIAMTSSAGNIVLACVGSASSGGSVAAPGPVTGLTLGTVTSSSLAFSWTAPTTGGTATYYQAQYRIYGSGASWTALGTNPITTSAVITGLSARTQYDVAVAANNTGGVASSFVTYGQSPAATSAVTLTPPGAPTGLASNGVTSSSAGLTWTAPTTGGSVASYSVQSSPHGANAWTTLSPAPTGTSATVPGLGASEYYDFQVAGVTSSGVIGAYDQITDVLTLAPSTYAPNVPASVATGTVTSSSVALNWTAPATDGSHNAATGYLVAYSSNGGSTWSTPVSAGNVTTYAFTGLTASTAYKVEVAATNSAGNSAYVTASVTTSSRSGSGAPNVVTFLAVGTVTGNTVPLSWTAPAVDGSHAAATAYTVQYRINGSSLWQTATSGATSSPYTATGLISGQTYQFNVFGTKTSGAGAGTTTTGTPTASGVAFEYWGTGAYPTSIVHSSTNALVVFLAAGTNVASCQFGYSATQFDPPTSLQTGTIYSSQVYGSLGAVAPATTGTYYGWMLFYDTGGDCIFAVVGSAGQTEHDGTAITPLITVT